jgi:hypothetical protein
MTTHSQVSPHEGIPLLEWLMCAYKHMFGLLTRPDNFSALYLKLCGSVEKIHGIVHTVRGDSH